MSTDISSEFDDIDFPKLERSLRSGRTLFSWVMSLVAGVLTVIASLPLFSVLLMLLFRGGEMIWTSGLSLFTDTPPAELEYGGGIGNAIMGTLVMVGIAASISIPFGILAAVVLAELSPDGKVTSAVRFCAKTLTGFPSILASVFVYAAFVVITGTSSAVAGGIALSILMLPMIMLTSEEAIKMVPRKMKEAAVGMGATRTQVVWKVLLPTAMPGILTGIMLAVARAAGETAPLLYTAGFALTNWIVDATGFYPMEPTASLSVLIYTYSTSAWEPKIKIAWAAALVLVVLVLMFNLLGQWLSSRMDMRR